MLYIVATPIGNLDDISQRARDVLNQVDVILAEDTRHSQRLLTHLGINKPLVSCHEHNENARIKQILGLLQDGQQLALISDAGTPLISDPGYVVVSAVREAGYAVSPIPGASSIIAALSVAGLPTDRFVFDGFLPAKAAARREVLGGYLQQTRTIVLLESTHRILACLQDVVAVLGGDREMVIARELTKTYETVLSGSAEQLLAILQADSQQSRGEFVILLKGSAAASADTAELDRVLNITLAELSLKQAVKLAAQITELNKNTVYQRALELKAL